MTEATPHILVCDDHKDIRIPLVRYLEKNGFRTTEAANGKELNTVLNSSNIDLIVLDILMPGESGLEICRRVRGTKDIPIILLTAVTDDMDKVIGIEMGADDYVTKPFNPRELLARIRGVLRRTNSLPKHYTELEADTLVFDDWHVNVDQQTLKRKGSNEPVNLTTSEFKILMIFLSYPKVVLSRDQLLDLVSGRESDVFDRSIDNQISRLRKKIELDPKNPKLIQTVWGSGYKFGTEVIKT